jgi:hypothetical protein
MLITRALKLLAATCTALCITTAQAQTDDAAELAKKLVNPVASLVSVPFQYNFDQNFGADDEGYKSVLNIQPVAPLALNDKWNLITRTIVPLVSAHDVPPGSSETGLGDIVQSFFFSPKEPVGGWVLAIGPALLYASASDETLGGEKWGAGPTALALKQDGPWTLGVLTNHIESFAGTDSRADVSSTFVQPFLTYITNTKTTFVLNTESTYDWKSEQWSVPVNVSVAQLLKAGSSIFQVTLGVRYWADSTPNGPEGLGFRAAVTFLFPT